MVGLLDIAPLSRKVKVGDDEVEVLGVSAFGIAKLLAKFPELRLLMTGQDVEVGPERIMEIAPEAISAIIAAGCGYPGDEKADAFVSKLPAHIQLDLLGPTLELTMPKGPKHFFEQLQAAMGVLGVSGLEKIVGTTSQPPSNASPVTATE
jgi:hypothetical protein